MNMLDKALKGGHASLVSFQDKSYTTLQVASCCLEVNMMIIGGGMAYTFLKIKERNALFVVQTGCQEQNAKHFFFKTEFVFRKDAKRMIKKISGEP